MLYFALDANELFSTKICKQNAPIDLGERYSTSDWLDKLAEGTVNQISKGQLNAQSNQQWDEKQLVKFQHNWLWRNVRVAGNAVWFQMHGWRQVPVQSRH